MAVSVSRKPQNMAGAHSAPSQRSPKAPTKFIGYLSGDVFFEVPLETTHAVPFPRPSQNPIDRPYKPQPTRSCVTF